MIKVEITRNSNHEIFKLKVSGHSGYDELGKDIVCSAVSTAMYVSVGILLKTNPNIKFLENENDATMNLEILKTDDYTNIVLNNLVEVFSSIAKDYSKFIKLINK